MTCSVCNSTWSDVYKMSGYDYLEDNRPVPLNRGELAVVLETLNVLSCPAAYTLGEQGGARRIGKTLVEVYRERMEK